MNDPKAITGYPSIDKPWLKYHTEEAITTPLPECTLYEYIFNSNQDNLNSIAINYYGTDITYGKFFDNISPVAGALERNRVKEGDIVTVCMINSPEAIELIFALNKIGATANMIYGISTVDEIEKYLIDTGSTIVVTLDIFHDKFVELTKKIRIDKVIVASQTQSMSNEEKEAMENIQIPVPEGEQFLSWEEFLTDARPSDTICRNPESAAIITYTGGTTGGSKGVVLSNKAIIAVTWQYCKLDIPMIRNSIWVQVLPLFIAYGATCSLTIPLSIGMKVVTRIPMTDSIADLCKKFKPNFLMYGPAYWEAFADDDENLEPSHFIDPVSGGDSLRANTENKINKYLLEHGSPCKIMNAYGMSEVSAAVSANIPKAHEFGSVGIPLVKNIIAAFDIETGEELKYGEEGEICIQTPSIMTGYVNNPDETNNIIKKHDDGLLWVHSGDLGYISENGFVHISGRLKRFMLCIANGVQKKIFSLDIEKVLLKYPKVDNCAVVPVPDEIINEAPAAYVILKKEYTNDENVETELRDYCINYLQDVYCPVKYFFVESFPRTKVGKVDYKALEARAKTAE